MTCVNLRSRRGVGAVLSTLLAIPFVAIVIGFMAYFGRALYAKAAIEDAAAVGARFAVTSLSGKKGCDQARQAMLKVLEGYRIDPAGAQMLVRPITAWGRGARAEVRVSYRVAQLPGLYFSKSLGDPLISARYEVVVDRYNNRWSNGWQPCVIAPPR